MAYSIDLAHIAHYRDSVALRADTAANDISILLVVAREETGSLEAQVRGSRYAWSVRILGVDCLHKLLRLKETLDDPAVAQQIQDVLIPQEFTRLDRIVDLVFATAEDAQETEATDAALDIEEDEPKPKSSAAFHAQIVPQLEEVLATPLVKRSRVTWASPSGEQLVSCQVASRRDDGRGDSLFWFGLKRKTDELLAATPGALCAFGLGSPDLVVLLPHSVIQGHLPGFFTSPDRDGGVLHYHVRFLQTGTKVELLTNRDRDPIDVTDRLLAQRTG